MIDGAPRIDAKHEKQSESDCRRRWNGSTGQRAGSNRHDSRSRGSLMIDTAVTVIAVLAAVGALVAAYQFARIRIYLGPLWRSDAGTIFAEHVLLSAVWFVWFLSYF